MKPYHPSMDPAIERLCRKLFPKGNSDESQPIPGGQMEVALAASPLPVAEPPCEASFPAFMDRLRQLPDGRRHAFLAKLMTPHLRLWFRACHALVHAKAEIQCDPELLDSLLLLPHHQERMARLHYELALQLRARVQSFAEESGIIEKFALEYGQPPGFVLDLATELATEPSNLAEVIGKAHPDSVWHGVLRGTERKDKVAGIVVARHRNPENDYPVLIFLTLEVLSCVDSDRRSVSLFPAPAFALWNRDEEFRKSERDVEAYVERTMARPQIVEVRWRFARHIERKLPSRICGPSLGLAFGFLLRRLLAEPHEPVATAKIVGVAFTGPLVSDCEASAKRLGTVGDLVLKTFAQGVDTIVAAGEGIDHPHILATDVPHIFFRPGGKSAHILLVSGIDEAAELLAVHGQSMEQAIDFTLPPPPKDFVGREVLTREILKFVDTTVSGYGVLVGSMGSGKTVFFRHLVGRLADKGYRPVCHFVPFQPGAASRGENLAKGLYYRLRRTYITAEPLAWSEWLIESRLAELLNCLSEKYKITGEKVVLVVDAADQAEVPSHKSLVPDELPGTLPPGVVCLISSNPGLGWLRDANPPPTFFGMREESPGFPLLTDDRADVETFLRKQRLANLPETLINEIVHQPQPPVFFTVVKRLTELQEANFYSNSPGDLLKNPGLWTEPPLELIKRRIRYILHIVFPDRDSGDALLRTLGVIATVREPVTEAQLRGLGLWQDGVTDIILRSAECFFFPRSSEAPNQDPFRFAHQSYPQVIAELLGPDGKVACHRLLAEKCLHWRKLKGTARLYALRRAPAHLRRAGMWDEHYEIMSDLDFLGQRMTVSHENSNPEEKGAASFSDSPQQLVFRVMRDFEVSLRGEHQIPKEHPQRKAMEALFRVIDQNLHVFQDAPHLIGQQLYNALAWEWDESTDLGRKLRRAMDDPVRIALRRINRPAESSGRLRCRKLKGHRKAVLCVALSPNEETLASASEDGTVILWRVATGELLRILRGHTGPVRSVTWSPDGRMLASAADKVRLWNLETGDCIREVAVNDGAFAVALSPVDGNLLAVATGEGGVRLFNTNRMDWEAVFRPNGPAVLCVAYSADGKLLAVGGKNSTGEQGMVEIYDATSRSLRHTLPASLYWIHVVAFSADRKLLATGGGVAKGEVRLIDVETGRFQRTLDVHRSGVGALALSRDGRLVTGSWDNTLALRELSTGNVLLTGMAHAGVVTSVAISRNGDLIASGSKDHMVIIWQIDPKLETDALRTPATPSRKGHEGNIYSSRFLPDGSLVATASVDGTARIFGCDGNSSGPVFSANGAVANVAVVSPDGLKLALGSWGFVKICEMNTGAGLRTLQGHQSYVLDAVWAPDGTRLLTVSEDTTAMWWDTVQGAWIFTLTGHTAPLRAAAISPDGRYAATAGDDTKIQVWDLQTGKLLITLHGHDRRVKALAYSPAGLLASAGSDDFVKLWDPLVGLEIGTLRVESSTPETWTLAFAPNRFLAAGGKDGMARIFDIETREAVACLPCSDVVQALWFSPDGSEFRVADRGIADLVPNIHVTRMAFPRKA